MDKIEPHEDGIERSSSSEKGRAVSIIETPLEDEVDTGEAGQPGGWRSKTGISVLNLGKWNHSFKLPRV